jgi:hypothetical protein
MIKLNHYQNVVKFSNGYSASIVSKLYAPGAGTYGADMGLFEVAVLDEAGNITYDTPVTSDVEGFLDFQGVADILKKIEALPKAKAVMVGVEHSSGEKEFFQE